MRKKGRLAYARGTAAPSRRSTSVLLAAWLDQYRERQRVGLCESVLLARESRESIGELTTPVVRLVQPPLELRFPAGQISGLE